MKKFLLTTLALLLCTFGVFAQVTTSSLTGTIKDSKETLIGATVKATHQPSGTVYASSTRADGRFTIPNMRVGGPYLIEVSYVGYQPQKFENITLNLAEPFILNVTLQATGTELREVSITAADPNSILNADRSGSTTNISRTQIQTLPTIGRSVNDLTRLTPQANGTSIGGGNYRSNNFTVDGSDFNNQFGIGSNIPAGGSPISLDALDQISINVTPFDVRQTGFIGASVNAVTRSGTNNFTGTGFFLLRNEDQRGDRVSGFDISPLQNYAQKQYGASVGGPIIKNKLFFFLNAEFSKITEPGQNRYAATPQIPFGTAGNTLVSRPTFDQLTSIHDYLLSRYGYEAGQFQGYSNKSNNDKLLARIDWNISNSHHFNIRYNQVESRSPSFVSTSRSPLSSFGQSRTGTNALHFSNSNYYQDANLYSLAAELNSSFGGKFSNILRGSYTHQNDPRSSDGAFFPFVDILSGGNPFTSFGYEPFTGGNLRDVETYSVTDNFTMSLGKHNLTVGVQGDFSTTKNGFQRFASSYYTFASLSDFMNGVKPTDFAITYSLLPGFEQAFPSFKFAQYAAYVQDEFTITDRFKLNLGLRAEQSSFPSVPEVKTHPLVAGLSFNGEKIDTGVLPENKLLLSPRASFNFDVKGDRSIQVRGGSGLFTGKVPFVWLVAQSGDAGLLQFTQTLSGASTPGPFNPDPAAYRPATPPVAGTSIPTQISAITPKFKALQTWKSSLGVDFKLPYGIVATIEGIYGKDINAAVGRNANLKNPNPLNVSGYPDNRPFYESGAFGRQNVSLTAGGLVTTAAATTNSSGFNVAVLDNAKGGHNYFVTAQLSKQFRKGLSAMIAYTHADARNFGDGGGDQLLNLWSIPVTSSNSNVASLSYTSNVIPNRVIAAVNYRKEYFKNLASTVSLFYEGSTASSGNASRFSYIYGGDFNRDGQTNDLIYIPRDPSEITFAAIPANTTGYKKAYTAQEQSDIFFNYIAQDKYLNSRKGQYAERNGAQFPWRNQVDFKFVQEVFRNVGNSKNSFQFTWDVFNLGNLINSDWGVYKSVNNASILIPQNQNTLTVGGTTRPTFRLANANGDIINSTFSTNQSITSTYYMQFGFRYNFN